MSEVSEANYGDFELIGIAIVSGEFGFVVIELGCVEGLDFETAAVAVAEAESGGGSRGGGERMG